MAVGSQRGIEIVRVVLLFSPLAFGACLGNDALDATCTPDAPDFSLDEDCLYANGNGPLVPKQSCDHREDEPFAARTWNDAWVVFSNPAAGNCANDDCHGTEEAAASNGIYLPLDEPAFYATLTDTKGSASDEPYLVANDAEDGVIQSWIYCNVAGLPGGGRYMPKPGGLPGTTVPDSAITIRDWVLSGAPGPGQ